MNNNKQSAFTLLELAIVITIIGTLAAGIIVGQDMINGAKARSVVAQIQQYQSATNNFQEKYNALPGDYNQATTNIPGVTNIFCNGNGDGYIWEYGIAPGPPPTAPSSLCYANDDLFMTFHHLSAAKFIDGNYNCVGGGVNLTGPFSNFPTIKTGSGGVFMFTYTDGNNYLHLGIAENTAVNACAQIPVGNFITPVIAYSIDTKMDNGLPGTGIVKAMGNVTMEDTPLANCASSTDYNIKFSSPSCQLRVLMD